MKRLSLAIIFFYTSSGINSWSQLAPKIKESQGSIVPSTEIRLAPGQDNVGNTPADVGGITSNNPASLYTSVQTARVSKPTAARARATPVPLTSRQALRMMPGSVAAKYSAPANLGGPVGLETGNHASVRTVRTDSQLVRRQLIDAGAIMLVQSVNPNSGFPEAYSLGRRGFEDLSFASSRREPIVRFGSFGGDWGNDPRAGKPADGSKKFEKPLVPATSGVAASQARARTPSASKPGAPAGSGSDGGKNGSGNNKSNNKLKGLSIGLLGLGALGSAGILFKTHHFGAYVLTNPLIAGIAILGIGLVGLGYLFLYKGRDATQARHDLQGLRLDRPPSDQERAAIRLKTDADIVRETGQTPKPFGRDSKTLEWDLGFASKKPSQQDGGFWQSLKELFSKETLTSLVRERHKLYSFPDIRAWGSANVSPVELPPARTGEKVGARLETGVSFFPSKIRTTISIAGAWWLAAVVAAVFLKGAAAIIVGGVLVVGGVAIAAYKFRIGSSVPETTVLGKASRAPEPVKKSPRNFAAIARKYYREGLLVGALFGILGFVGYKAYHYKAPAEQAATPKTEKIVTQLVINPDWKRNIDGAGSNGDIKDQGKGKGGGGGGKHEKTKSTWGHTAPMSRTQFTPPTTHPLPHPKMPARQTVLGDIEEPDLKPDLKIGNAESLIKTGPPSDGTGDGGGIGETKGRGSGSGEGDGNGPGSKYGRGGGEPGNGGGKPSPTYSGPVIFYTDAAKTAHFQGKVIADFWVIQVNGGLQLVPDPTGANPKANPNDPKSLVKVENGLWDLDKAVTQRVVESIQKGWYGVPQVWFDTTKYTYNGKPCVHMRFPVKFQNPVH